MFAKVFTQIFDSSIADDRALRHFFIDMLILADAEGFVDMTPSAIAGRTRWPLAEVEANLQKLSEPDSQSRTPDCDGRRIELLDEHRTWGWRIINYENFRAIASDEQRKSKQRERFHRWKHKGKSAANAPLTVANAPLTVTDAANAMQKQKQKQKQKQREGEKTPPDDRKMKNGILFEPVRLGLYRREYAEMVKDAQQAIHRIKSDPKNFAKDLSKPAADLIAWLEREKPENWQKRIQDALQKSDSFERKNLKPNPAAAVQSWLSRIEEIKRAMDGIKE